MNNTFQNKMSSYAVHKARMDNKKMSRQNANPRSGFWNYKMNRRGESATAVSRRLKALSIPIDLNKHEDRSMMGYCYLEYVKNEHL